MTGDANVTVLRSPRRRSLLFTLLNALFVATGIGMIADGDATGWFVTLFFGLGLVVLGARLVRPGKLILTDDGFEMVTLNRTPHYFPWRNCGHFSVSQMTPLRSMVVFDWDGPEIRRHRRLVAVSRGLTGAAGALPETYGLKATDLARLLNDRQLRATTRHSTSSDDDKADPN